MKFKLKNKLDKSLSKNLSEKIWNYIKILTGGKKNSNTKKIFKYSKKKKKLLKIVYKKNYDCQNIYI